MESRNKLIMCRLCLDENGCFINVFELNDLHSYVAADVITDLLQFQISDTDGYPQVVCLTCLAKLTEFKLFKERCQKSIVTYDNMFVSCEKVEDHRPDMWESGTVKAEPIFYSDNVGDVSKEVGRDSELSDQDPLREASPQEVGRDPELCDQDPLREASPQAVGRDPELCDQDPLREASPQEVERDPELCDQDPLREASSPVTVKSEEVIIDSSSYEVSEDPLKTNEVSCGPILLKYEVLPFSRDSHTQKDLIDSNRSENQGTAALIQDSPQEEGKGTIPEKGIERKHQEFQCHCCTKVLPTKSGLKKHLISHGIGKFFKCDICGKSFVYKSYLVSHMPKHTREKPFKCTHCYRSYIRHNVLKVHMRIHTERKPFKCENCKMSFNRSSDLEKHVLRIHSGLRPYSCEVCHTNFKQMSNLAWHMRSHR